MVEEKELDLFVENENGEYPLHIASKYNFNPEVVSYLISKKCDVNQENEEGITPFECSFENVIEMCVYYIDNNIIDLKSFKENKKDFPFHLVKTCRYSDTLYYIINALNVDACIEDKNGDNLLHNCLLNYENLEIVKYLVERMHLDLNKLNHKGQSPLEIAFLNYASNDVIKYIVKNGDYDLVQRDQPNSPNLLEKLFLSLLQIDLDMFKFLFEEKKCDINSTYNFQATNATYGLQNWGKKNKKKLKNSIIKLKKYIKKKKIKKSKKIKIRFMF